MGLIAARREETVEGVGGAGRDSRRSSARARTSRVSPAEAAAAIRVRSMTSRWAWLPPSVCPGRTQNRVSAAAAWSPAANAEKP